MLSIRNLCYHPPATPEAILQNISFELQDRQLGLMVGPSGSGKSTLLWLRAAASRPAARLRTDHRGTGAPPGGR